MHGEPEFDHNVWPNFNPSFFPKTSRPVLANQEIVDHMVKDIEKLDIGNNGRQTLQARTEKDCDDGFDNECENNVYSFGLLYRHPFVFSCYGAVNASYFAWMMSLFCLIFWISVLEDFVDLLREQAPLESYVEWLDRLVETKIIRVSRLHVMCTWSLHSITFWQLCGKCFIYEFVTVFFQPCEEAGDDFKSRAQEFLLRWSFLGARLMHNLTLNASSYFGEIKLISYFNNLNQSSHIFI